MKEEKNASKRGEREGREIKNILGEERQLGELEERRRKYIKKTEEGNIWREPPLVEEGEGGEENRRLPLQIPHHILSHQHHQHHCRRQHHRESFRSLCDLIKMQCSCLQLVTCG